MHRASAIESAVSFATSTPRERVRYLARRLVEAKVWPDSRGRTNRPLLAAHAVPLIVAIAFDEKRGDLAGMVAEYCTLELQAPDGPMAEMAGSTLLLTLNGLLAPECRLNVGMKLYRHTGGEAAAAVIAEGEDGKAVLWPFWRSPHWSGWTRRTWELAPEGFTILRNLLARDDLAELELKRA